MIISATMTSITSFPHHEQPSSSFIQRYILSLLFSPIAPTFICFIPLSIFSIYCNYRSNLHVTTNTLNVPRTEMILRDFLSECHHHSSSKDYFSPSELQDEKRQKLPSPPPPPSSPQSIQSIKDLIATPKDISTRETFVMKYHSPFKIPLLIEPALDNYIISGGQRQKLRKNDWETNLHCCLKQIGFLCPEEYFIFLCPPTTITSANTITDTTTTHTSPFYIRQSKRCEQNHVAIWFSQNAKSKDIIKGFYHACVIRYMLEKREERFVIDLASPSGDPPGDSNSRKNHNHYDHNNHYHYDVVSSIVRKSHEWVNNSFDPFINGLEEKKWDVEHHFLVNNRDDVIEGRLSVEFK